MGRSLYVKLIGRIAFFTCGNIAHIEFYLQGLLPKILAICTINNIYYLKSLTVMKEMVSVQCATIELYMHLGGLLSTQEARVARGDSLVRLLRFSRA